MIKGLEQSSQPREKALLNGIESLTDEELLALLLRTGNKEQSVLDLSSIKRNTGNEWISFYYFCKAIIF